MKTSIQSIDEYYQLYQVVAEAQDRLDGDDGETGIHYSLAWILRGYGIFSNGRQDVVKQGWKLIERYEKENLT